MLKKLMLLIVVGLVVLAYPNPLVAQDADTTGFKTEVFALLCGKLIIPDGTSKGYAAGADFKVGVRPTQHFIAWVTASERKIVDTETEQSSEADEGKLGVSFVFPDIWPAIRLSTYATFAAGAGKVDGEPVDFSKAVGGGMFFEITKKFKLWTGLDWDNTGQMNVTAVHLGTSWNL